MLKNTDPVFTISLQRGLADRHRLPIGQVISVLNEVRQMLIETGREIQKERGIDPRPLDFGLELVAEEDGKTFTKGSLRARIAITNNVEVGIEAAERVLDTVYALNAPRKPSARFITATQEPATAKIVNRLDRIAFIHEQSRAQARFQVAVPKALQPLQPEVKTRTTATFGSMAVKRIAAMREPVFTEEDVTLYGRLVELKDKAQIEVQGGKFWGELRRDNGERWRVQFDDEYQTTAAPLFRQQVRISGNAYYFQTRAPKLVATEVVPDEQRDYVGAFDELLGVNKALYKADLATLLDRRYGED